MLGVVTAVHSDGAKWGWPGERVYRYLGEDESWAWVPQRADGSVALGDIIDLVDEGWEWLADDGRTRKIVQLAHKTRRERIAVLRRLQRRAERADGPPTKRPSPPPTKRHSAKKTPSQLEREIASVLKTR